MSLKSLALRFLSSFAVPKHLQKEEPEAIQHKVNQIKLTALTVTEKIGVAKKVQPEVIKFMDEKLKENATKKMPPLPLMPWPSQWVERHIKQ